MSSHSLLESARSTLRQGLSQFPDAKMTTGLNISGSVLLDISASHGFHGEVLFVDTGYHFPETLRLWQGIQDRYPEVRFRLLSAGNDYSTLYLTEPERCCAVNKVDPLQDYLRSEGVSALLNARTQESAPGRREISAIEEGTPTRINPLFNWDRGALETYATKHDLPVHPLYEQGFLSMGCWPCTKAVRPGEDPRSGRFVGQGRTECGIWAPLTTRNPSPSTNTTTKN